MVTGKGTYIAIECKKRRNVLLEPLTTISTKATKLPSTLKRSKLTANRCHVWSNYLWKPTSPKPGVPRLVNYDITGSIEAEGGLQIDGK